MAVVKCTQVINKPVDVVFQTVVDVANFPNWNPTIPSARKLPNGEIANGTPFELEIRGFGKSSRSCMSSIATNRCGRSPASSSWHPQP